MKKSFYTLFIVVSALLAIVTAAPAFGAGKKKPTPAPEHKQPVISSVSANTITVAEEKAAKTYTVTQFTEITVNGQRGTIADLKPGMTVSVTLGTDASKASRVVASGK